MTFIYFKCYTYYILQMYINYFNVYFHKLQIYIAFYYQKKYLYLKVCSSFKLQSEIYKKEKLKNVNIFI
jgi:hypothetical protein